MSDHIFWQSFELVEVFHQGADSIILSAELYRDESFNLIGKFLCDNKYEQEFMNYSQDAQEILFRETRGIFTAHNTSSLSSFHFRISDFTIKHIRFLPMENKIEVVCRIYRIIKELSMKKKGSTKFEIYWFLGNSHDLAYPEATAINAEISKTVALGSFEKFKLEYSPKGESGWHRNIIKLQVDGISFILGTVDKKYTNDKPLASFLRVEKGKFLCSEIIGHLTQILSFILGVDFLVIGHSKFNEYFESIYDEYRSSDLKGLHCRQKSMVIPALPIYDDYSQIPPSPSEQIDAFIEGYFSKLEEYSMLKILWQVNYARGQHPSFKIQPLSAVFDMLNKAYLKGHFRTVIEPKEFKEILAKLKNVINAANIDENDKKQLCNHLNNVNDQTHTQRNRQLFQELGLEISDLEKEAFKSRNKVIHGSKEIKSDFEIRNASAFQILITRIILKILNIPFYSDWSLPTQEARRTEEPIKGKFQIRTMRV